MRAITSVVLAIALLCISAERANSQAVPTATGPGSSLALGGGVSGFQTDYGHTHVGGFWVYGDVQPHWRIGAEGEVRRLRWGSQEDVTETDYLGGIRAMLPRRPGRYGPYVKFLAGVGRITLPYGYAHGTYLALAPGAGLDIALSERFTLRAIDFEYQQWPQFSYGTLNPYGFSSGITLRLNKTAHFPKSR